MKAFTHKLSDPLPELHDHHIFEEREARREQWDEAAEHQNDLQWESIMSEEIGYGPTENGFPWK